MYKVITWRYGKRYAFEFGSFEEANNFFEADTDEHFAEFILDENGNVLRDGKENVIGYRETE
jgi:hypothetical protein